MIKRLLSFLITALAAFALTGCFDVEQNYTLVNGSYIYNAVFSFRKDALALAEITADSLRNDLLEGEAYEELKEKFDDISVTEDEKNAFISLTETLADTSSELPSVTDEKISIQFKNDTAGESITGIRHKMDSDPEYKAMADILFAESLWKINIDKAITETVSAARLTDDEGRSVEVPVQEKESCFMICFPMLTFLDSELLFTGIEIYR